MSHRTSSAASHAANNLLKHFDVVLRPEHERRGYPANIQASEHHIGVTIDLATNAFEVAKIREPLRHWQEVLHHGINDTHTANQILYYVQRVVAAMEKVPRYANEEEAETVMSKMPTPMGGTMRRLTLTKAAVEATRLLLAVYRITLKSDPTKDPRLVRLEVARAIDVSLGLHQALKALPNMKKCEALMRRGQLYPKQVAAYLRDLGVRLEYLPNFRERRDEVKLLA